MRTKINAKVLLMGILLVIPLLCFAADIKMDPYQEINTNINRDNNTLYRYNTEINQLNREDNVRDKCVEVRNKINRKIEDIGRAQRTRSPENEQTLKQELQYLQGQKTQYCQ